MHYKKQFIVGIALFILVFTGRAQVVLNPGLYQKICPGATVTLGGNPTAQASTPPYTYTWMPANSLNYPDSANPIASPTVTTTYTLMVTVLTKLYTDTVTIYVYPYTISARPDTTAKQGETIALHGQAPGATSVYWSCPNTVISNSDSLNPSVLLQSGGQDTVVLTANFPNNCVVYNYVVINVTPNSGLVFYNSFTPNGDGANDAFFIGNIGLYPNNTLEIYNRYGQKIYTKTGYANDWNGTYLGTELPSGTYFYILDTHDTPGKYRGEVSIIR